MTLALSAVLAVATTVEPDAIRLRGRYGAILDRLIAADANRAPLR